MPERRLRRRLAAIDEDLTARPVAALGDVLHKPEPFVSPVRRILRRMSYAMVALSGVVLAVYLDRDGYTDAADGKVSFLDCVYYATVSLSTTGYGDIAPITPTARLVNVVVVTPLRAVFLIILIGTTVETLTTQSRQALKVQRWRSAVRNHTIVIGYGTKGRAAVAALVGDAVAPAEIVVVDSSRGALERAIGAGLVTIRGDATRSDILRLAGAQSAKSIIVATDEDAITVLVTLTARELAPRAQIVAAARELQNQHLLRRSGADSTVVSSDTAGRLLGIATTKPSVVDMMEQLLAPGAGATVTERDITPMESGLSPRHLTEVVLAVVRDGRLLRADVEAAQTLVAGDRLLCIRDTNGKQ